jgi:hypothetical protein
MASKVLSRKFNNFNYQRELVSFGALFENYQRRSLAPVRYVAQATRSVSVIYVVE